MNLALDLDGVLFDFDTHFVALARKTYPSLICPDVDKEWPVDWNYLDAYLSRREVSKLWRTIIASPSFWRACPAYPWANELLRTAYTRADKLYFITSRSGHRVQEQTWLALQELAPAIFPSGAVIPVPQPADKLPLLTDLHIDYFVDDKKETVSLALAAGIQTACWDQPWNHDTYFPTRLTSVEDFRQWLT